VLACALLTVLAVTATRASAATLTVNTTVDETTPGARRATVTYSDTLPASVTFVVLTRRGKRLVSVERFHHTDKVGVNTVTFTGRLGGRKLKRGSHRLQATPRANRMIGKKVTLTFRITG
jgi:hypothetical protein